jgi:NTP pyrophosphatase (non-canonical NTP hydrolase)
LDFVEKQKEVTEWRAKNFTGENRPTLLRQAAGAVGEAGEAVQAALKYSDRRETWTVTRNAIVDAIGDQIIYNMGLCDLLGVTLEECFEFAWDRVKNRTLENWDV